MTKFIETKSGEFIATSLIRRILPIKGTVPSCKIIVSVGMGETSYEVASTADETVAEISRMVVPAAPGFFTISSNVRDCSIEEFTLWKSAVIAWDISGPSSCPVPITLEGAWDGGREADILIIAPDGKVVDQIVRAFSSVEEAYNTLKSEENGEVGDAD